MAVCCQNLPLGALSSRSAPSVLVSELFKKFGLFLNSPEIQENAITARRHKKCVPGNIPAIEETLGTVYRQ